MKVEVHLQKKLDKERLRFGTDSLLKSQFDSKSRSFCETTNIL
jgi:hypothetical protein